MRKRIPTITRPDQAYAASLRPKVEADPGREVAQRPAVLSMTSDVENVAGQEPSAPTPDLEQHSAAVNAPPFKASSPRTQRLPATRKIDIRVNALERQEKALIDCGVDPAHVIRAALRRATKNWELAPEFVAPSEDQRTRITEWRARTSLAVDANAVAALLRVHDPLDVLSKWTLIRGQLERRVWIEIDRLLEQIETERSRE